MKRLLFVVILTVATLLAPVRSAPLAPLEEAPRANSRGDWMRNVGYVTGKVPSRSLMPGSLWRVVAVRAEGRAAPTPSARLVQTFARGAVLQADVGRGGADEVLENARDGEGRPWMRVRSVNGQSLDCYVRANQAIIRPLRVGEKI